MGFLDFADGKDEDAAREFSLAYELDGRRYLSLFFKTMLSPIARSDASADQASFRNALLKTTELNPEFAPPYIQLAKLDVRQGDLDSALAASRKAEQLEPSRAGYHLLSGQIMLRLGRAADAAAFAKYVAERWSGVDHDEAVELWQSVPAQFRPAGDSPSETAIEGTQTVTGRIKSATCGDKHQKPSFVLDHEGQALIFRSKENWGGGFSDTLWYGVDHFDSCRHVEGMRAVVRYKPPADKSYTGEIAEVGFREDLPASREVAQKEQAPSEVKQ
jgi:tetratricopeptide (TPR) repeat protein